MLVLILVNNFLLKKRCNTCSSTVSNCLTCKGDRGVGLNA